MQAQAVGAGQISDALAQLSDAVTQTVESLHQSSQAIDELNQVAAGLRGSITRFRLQA
jgi:methyl-accepting chemotaxis protein WspA